MRNLVERLRAQGMGTRGIQQTPAVLRNALQRAMRDELVVRNVGRLRSELAVNRRGIKKPQVRHVA